MSGPEELLGLVCACMRARVQCACVASPVRFPTAFKKAKAGTRQPRNGVACSDCVSGGEEANLTRSVTPGPRWIAWVRIFSDPERVYTRGAGIVGPHRISSLDPSSRTDS